MLNSVTAKSIVAAAAAAALVAASLAIALTSAVPEAEAKSPFEGAPHAVGNLVPAPVKGAACPLRGWPHYEQACQFDLRRPANAARAVRIIAQR